MRKQIMRKMYVLLLGLLVALSTLLPVNVGAASAAGDGVLKIKAATGDGVVLDGLVFHAYQVATIGGTNNDAYALTADFQDSGIDVAALQGKSLVVQSDGEAILAQAANYINNKQLAATASMVTDAKGEGGFSGLANGLYLVYSPTEKIPADSMTTYQAAPFLVRIPYVDESGKSSLNITANAKFTQKNFYYGVEGYYVTHPLGNEEGTIVASDSVVGPVELRGKTQLRQMATANVQDDTVTDEAVDNDFYTSTATKYTGEDGIQGVYTYMPAYTAMNGVTSLTATTPYDENDPDNYPKLIVYYERSETEIPDDEVPTGDKHYYYKVWANYYLHKADGSYELEAEDVLVVPTPSEDVADAEAMAEGIANQTVTAGDDPSSADGALNFSASDYTKHGDYTYSYISDTNGKPVKANVESKILVKDSTPENPYVYELVMNYERPEEESIIPPPETPTGDKHYYFKIWANYITHHLDGTDEIVTDVLVVPTPQEGVADKDAREEGTENQVVTAGDEPSDVSGAANFDQASYTVYAGNTYTYMVADPRNVKTQTLAVPDKVYELVLWYERSETTIPDEGVPGDPGDPTPDTTITPPPTPTSGTPPTTITTPTPNVPTTSTPTPTTVSIGNNAVPLSALPQTGLLWWPVPVLAILGLSLFTIGYTGKRKA